MKKAKQTKTPKPSKPDYKVYPSLLDKFQEFLDYEQAAEEPWNKVSESALAAGKYPDKEVGDYILTPDEMCDKLEQELVDTINRVEHEPWEAADKGTCFNEIIDMLIDGRDCQYEGMVVTMEEDKNAVTATLDGFTFMYDLEFCKQVAEGLKDSASQVFTKATIETEHGLVELYGYVDEFRYNQVIDLKTSTSYDFLRFEQKWQRHVYPYCLTENGYEVQGFEYRVIKWKGGTTTQPLLSGEIIPEYYTYTHEDSKDALVAILDQFLDWLDLNRDRITDKKIFCCDNEKVESVDQEQVQEVKEEHKNEDSHKPTITPEIAKRHSEIWCMERLKCVFEWDLERRIKVFDRTYTDEYPCDDPESWYSLLAEDFKAHEMVIRMSSRLCDIQALEDAIKALKNAES